MVGGEGTGFKSVGSHKNLLTKLIHIFINDFPWRDGPDYSAISVRSQKTNILNSIFFFKRKKILPHGRLVQYNLPSQKLYSEKKKKKKSHAPSRLEISQKLSVSLFVMV